VLFAFDFDGTLAPIVDNPNYAAMTLDVFRRLQALANRKKTVILTGRSVGDVQSRLPSGIHKVVGSHGMEGHPDVSDDFLAYARSTTETWITQLSSQLEGLHRVWIENKEFSLAVHYRTRASSHDLPTKLQAKCKLLNPVPEVIYGKNVINLIPNGMPNKLGAINAVMRSLNLERAFFVGDDITDEFIFAAKSKNIFSVKVGLNPLLSAEYYIETQFEIQRLLDFLLESTK
jgi:trehalose 6-phosphate phosphatase